MSRFFILLFLLLLLRILTFYDSNFTISDNKANKTQKVWVFTSVKERISDNFQKTIPADHAYLLLGIVLGDKGDFSKEYFEAFRKTGVMHVIAASGMNVSMVSSFLLAIFARLLRKQIALIATALAIIIYAGLANFEPSIVRASIMAIIAFGAGLLGRQNTSIIALMLTGFIMIMFDPRIIEDIGFQLSFAATLGIVLLDPIFARIMGKKAFIEDARTTLSAQIATVPILLFFFGNYSPISIVTNLLILWTIPPLMILGAMASILSLIIPILATPFLYISLPLLMFFKEVVMITSKFAPEFKVQGVPWSIVVGYYFILLSSIMAIYKREKINI